MEEVAFERNGARSRLPMDRTRSRDDESSDYLRSKSNPLGGHPIPAIEGHLKSGQRRRHYLGPWSRDFPRPNWLSGGSGKAKRNKGNREEIGISRGLLIGSAKLGSLAGFSLAGF
jgi:hypothetical protein